MVIIEFDDFNDNTPPTMLKTFILIKVEFIHEESEKIYPVFINKSFTFKFISIKVEKYAIKAFWDIVELLKKWFVRVIVSKKDWKIIANLILF